MRGVTAKGYALSPDRFLIPAGTPISPTVSDSFRGSSEMKKRERLIADGIIADNKFARDFEFKTPSGAGGIIVGTGINGRACWKAADGRTFAEVFPK